MKSIVSAQLRIAFAFIKPNEWYKSTVQLELGPALVK